MTWTYTQIKQPPKVYLHVRRTQLQPLNVPGSTVPPDYYMGRSTCLEVRCHMFWIWRCFVFSFGMSCFGLLQHVPHHFAPPGGRACIHPCPDAYPLPFLFCAVDFDVGETASVQDSKIDRNPVRFLLLILPTLFYCVSVLALLRVAQFYSLC